MATAKAAFEASEKMMNGNYKPPDPETFVAVVDSQEGSALAVGDHEHVATASNHEMDDESHRLSEAVQKVDLENILEKVKSETEAEKAVKVITNQVDDESVKSKGSAQSKASVQSKAGSILSMASKGSIKSVASKSKVTTKTSSKGSAASAMKSTSSPSSLSSRGSVSKAKTTASNVMTRRSNLTPAPPARSSSRDSYFRPPTIPTSRKAPIPSAKVKKTKAATTTATKKSAR